MLGKKVMIGVLSVLLVLGGFALAFGKTTVTFWHCVTWEPGKSSMQRVVDEFNKQNPDIEVKATIVPASDVTDISKFLTAVAGGVAPDVYYVDRFTVAQRAVAGVLEPLNDLTDEAEIEKLKEMCLPFAWEEVNWDGKVWALPHHTDARALYYRIDHLKEAGFDAPPKTIDELDMYAEKLTKQGPGGRFERIGFIPWFNQGFPYTWGWAFGGEFYDPETKKLTITDPNIVKSLEWQKSYADKYGIGAIQSFSSAFGAEAQDPFIMGMVSMIVDGDWRLSSFDMFAPDMKWEEDYEATYIPRPAELADTPITWAGGWSLGISKGAKNVKEGFEFMKFVCGPIGQKIYGTGAFALPTVPELLEDEEIREEERHAFFIDLLPYAKCRPPLPVGALLWDELTTARDAVINGLKTPEEACRNVEERVQPELDKYFE